jgi:hypothetical protein
MAVLKRYNGSTWDYVVGGSGITKQASAPSNPNVDDLWLDTDAIASTQTTGLIAEQVVTGSDTTSVIFTGLDGNSHGGYILVCLCKNMQNSQVSLYINGDTTATNYYTDEWYNTAATTLGRSVTNGSRVFYSDAGSNTHSVVQIDRNVGGFPTMISEIVRKTAAYNIEQNKNSILGTVSITNITSLSITHGSASGIGVGSIFRLYRRK